MFPNLTDRLHGHLHQLTFKQHASKKLASIATTGTDHRLLHGGNQIEPTAGSTGIGIGHDMPCHHGAQVKRGKHSSTTTRTLVSQVLRAKHTMNRKSDKQQSFQRLGTATILPVTTTAGVRQSQSTSYCVLFLIRHAVNTADLKSSITSECSFRHLASQPCHVPHSLAITHEKHRYSGTNCCPEISH